jgi:hypothetical protein
LVRREKFSQESTTKVNDLPATVPRHTFVSGGGKRDQASSFQKLGVGGGYWFNRLNKGLGCLALGAVHFPMPPLSADWTWLGGRPGVRTCLSPMPWIVTEEAYTWGSRSMGWTWAGSLKWSKGLGI